MTYLPNKAGEKPSCFKGLSLIGGHPALDLVNTVKYRGAADPQDKFESMSDVMIWAQTSGLISHQAFTKISFDKIPPNTTPQDRKLLDRIRSFREQFRILFRESALQSTELKAARTSVELAISDIKFVVKIDKETGVLTQTIALTKPSDIYSSIVASAADLLTKIGSLKVSVCAGSDCDWLFIDRTKAKRRQWCDTKTCGNLARVRKFRSRRKI